MYQQQRRLVTRTVTQGGMQFQVQEEVVEYVHVPDPPTEEVQEEAVEYVHVPDPAPPREEVIADYKAKVLATFEQTKRELGYLPPHDSPLLMTRALREAVAVLKDIDAPELQSAIIEVEREIEMQFGAAHGFVRRLREKLAEPEPLLQRLKRASGLAPKIDALIDKATISLDMPKVGSAALSDRMRNIEMFLGQDWTTESQRGVLAVHVDKAGPATIVQIGIAEHGPLYICLPGLLSPEELAQHSIYELVQRMEPFRALVDPMAVINGGHQGVNYNPLFKAARVIRAPSGDTARLMSNLGTTRARTRMESANTAIINSAPTTRQEYAAVFEDDPTAASWPRWDGVAAQWSGAATHDGFAVGPEASREALLTALATKENVVVVMAHCNGQQLFLPHPPPQGTDITAEHLRQRRDEIGENKPFVLLFSCQAGRMSDVMSFAEVLLECGAAGVIAAQGNVGATALDYLTRLLGRARGTPPIEDVWKAMRDTNFYEMEAFLG
jgi:hypothetical protein